MTWMDRRPQDTGYGQKDCAPEDVILRPNEVRPKDLPSASLSINQRNHSFDKSFQ
jgi:hypothetical protein